MVEKFIERATDFELEQGKLSVYETNCTCRDVKFYFEQNVLTVMLSGHKTVVSQKLRVEFFPGTFFIPEKDTVQKVDISNASVHNPTKCLVLELKPSFLSTFHEEVMLSDSYRDILFKGEVVENHQHFLSNDQRLINAFSRLYENQFNTEGTARDMIDTLIIKEMLILLFQTEAIHLLKQNFENSVDNVDIQRSISFIKSNLRRKIMIDHLVKVSGFGLTTFFKKFKEATGQSPADYILHERISQSKILIQKKQLSLKEIAYKCGFNSYEYFCSSFKKIEKTNPSAFQGMY